jgi:diadenosine tetraphosphate (Ap4A) HIT family hydrolase
MLAQSTCGLCHDIKTDSVIFDSQNFAVLPSFGQLSDEGGYLLIVTKEHSYTSTSGFSTELYQELEQLMIEAAEIIRETYDVNALFFEHGSTCHSKGGQCVTHMHMNLVPYAIDLSNYLRPERRIELANLTELSNVEPPYLYVRTPEGKHFAESSLGLDIPSQYLRAAIGRELGHPERSFWDWRVRRGMDNGYSDEDAMAKTMEKLRLSFNRNTDIAGVE